MRASPATTIMGRMVRARRTLQRRWTAAPTPSSCSTGRSTTPRPSSATCATCAGSTAGSAAWRCQRRRHRRPGRPSTTSWSCSTSGRAAPTSRSRSWTGPRRAAGAGRSSRSTAGPRSSPRPRSPARAGDTDGLELHVGDGRSLPFPDRSFDVAHCSLVLHHLHAGRGRRAAPRDGPGRAARRRRQRPRSTPARLARRVAARATC